MAERRGIFGGGFNPFRFTGQPNDQLMMAGAALSSLGNGGDPSAMFGVGQMIRQRNLDRQNQIAMDRFRSDIAPHDGPGGSGTGPAKTRAEIEQALLGGITNGLNLGPAAQAWQSLNPAPQTFNTSRGIVRVDRDGTAQTLFDIPADPPKASPGWNINPDGSWSPVKGGPYDPDYVRSTAETRRQVVTQNPMPRAARSASSGGGAPRSAATTSARRPWENYR